MAILSAPGSLKKPALSGTRWLAKVKRDFDADITRGRRHQQHGSRVISVGAGLPHGDTYNVARALYRGTDFALHQAGVRHPKSISGWLDVLGNPGAAFRRHQEAIKKLSEMFNYGSTQGLPIVRESFANLMQGDWNYDFNPENVLPVSGGTTSIIDLLTRSFERIDQDFVVITSRPAYTGTVARLNEAKNISVMSVVTDEYGMIPEVLEETIQKAKKKNKAIAFVIDVTLGHNPLGISYSADRINKIYEILQRHNLIFVEDNPYGMFDYTNRNSVPPTFTGIDADKRVVTAITFSKTDIPTFRSAFAHADVRYTMPDGSMVTLMDMMMAAGGMAYLVPNNLSQLMTVAQWYKPDLEIMGSLWPEARERTKIYAANREALLNSLDSHFKDFPAGMFHWNRPDSGFFLRFTMTLRPQHPHEQRDMTAREIVQWLMENEFLITTPMSGFYSQDAKEENPDIGENELRICFSFGSPDDMAEAGKRLASGMSQLFHLNQP